MANDAPAHLGDSADVVVIGTGAAGLAAALAAHRAGRRVIVLSKAGSQRKSTATHYAQGGIAVVLPGNDDSVEAHVADTLAAGAGTVRRRRGVLDRRRRLPRGVRTGR